MSGDRPPEILTIPELPGSKKSVLSNNELLARLSGEPPALSNDQLLEQIAPKDYSGNFGASPLTGGMPAFDPATAAVTGPGLTDENPIRLRTRLAQARSAERQRTDLIVPPSDVERAARVAPPTDPNAGLRYGYAANIGPAISESLINTFGNVAEGIHAPINRLYENQIAPLLNPNQTIDAYMKMTPKQRAEWDKAHGFWSAFDESAASMGQAAMGALPAAALPMAVGKFAKDEVDQAKREGGAPAVARFAERAANLPWETLHKVGEGVTSLTGSEAAGIAAELLAMHGAGIAEGKVRDEIGLRNGIKPDAAALEARRPGATVDAAQPESYRDLPKLEGARYVRGGSPFEGVRTSPEIPKALPNNGFPITPYPGGPGERVSSGPGVMEGPYTFPPGAPLPGGPVATAPALPEGPPAPRALPDPNEFGRNKGTIIPKAELDAAARGSVGVLPEQRRLPEYTGRPGVMLPPEEAAAAREAAAAAQRGPTGVTPDQLRLPEWTGFDQRNPRDLAVIAPKVEPVPPAKPVDTTIRVPDLRDPKTKKPIVGTPTEGTGPTPGEGVRPSGTIVNTPATPVSPLDKSGVATANLGGQGAKAAGTDVADFKRFGRRRPIDLVPPAAEKTVPTAREREIAAAGGPEKVAADTGRVVVTQADGTKAIVGPEDAANAQRLANAGKLAELVNGEGTSPKPAAPTEMVTARDAAGNETRTVLTDTPEKTAAALVANPGAEVKPATPENVARTLEERGTEKPAAEPVATPDVAAATPRVAEPPAPAVAPEPAPDVPAKAVGTDSSSAPESTGAADQGAAPPKPPEAPRTAPEPSKTIPHSVAWTAARELRRAAEVESELSMLNAFKMRGAEAASDFRMKPEERAQAQADVADLRSLAEKNGWNWDDFVAEVRKQRNLNERFQTPEEANDWERTGGDATFARLVEHTNTLSQPGKSLAREHAENPLQTRPLAERISGKPAEAPKPEAAPPAPEASAAEEPISVPPPPPRETAYVPKRFGRLPAGVYHDDVGALRMKLADLNTDPVRFQHKEADNAGLTPRLKKTTKWEEPATPITVWQDPANGKVYVINGHQRYGLAKRLGQPDVPVKFLTPEQAPDAAAARLEGAKENIREGHATPIEAARFFREIKLPPDQVDGYLKGIGASDTAPGIAEGRAIAALPDALFNDVVHGDMRVNRAVAFGDAVRENDLSPDQALQLFEHSKKSPDGDLSGIARSIKIAGETSKGPEQGLFGVIEAPKSLFAEEGRLRSKLLSDLAQDKRVAGSTVRNAAILKAKGIADVNVDKGQEAVDTSKTLYDSAKSYFRMARSPLDDFISEAAKEVDRGGNFEKVSAELNRRATEWLMADPSTRNELEAKRPKDAGPSLFGAGGSGTMRRGGSQSGAVRIPTAKEMMDAFERVSEEGAKAWQAAAKPLFDGVSKIADKVPFVARLRQSGIHDALAVDPSEKVFGAHVRRKGIIESGERTAEQYARTLEKVTRRVGKLDADATYRYMGGERPDLPASVKPHQAVIDAAVAEMHRTRAEMLARHIISPEVFAEYPRFVSRLFRVRAMEGQGYGANLARLKDEMYRQDAHGVIVDAPQAEMEVVAAPHNPKVVVGSGTAKPSRPPGFLKPAAGHETTLLKFDTVEQREAFMKDLAAWEASKRGPTVGGAPAGGHVSARGAEPLVVERFDPLSPDVREALGEITDPADSYAMTLARARTKIATFDQLALIDKMGKGQPGGDWVMPNGVGPDLKGYTQVHGRGWGTLDGKWLRNDIHEYASGMVTPRSMNAILSGIESGISEWKWVRTVGNWPTVAANYLASHVMSVQAGVNFANPVNWPYWNSAIKALTGQDPALQKRALEEGWIGNDLYSAEFKSRVERALHGSDNPVAAIFEAAKASKNPMLTESQHQMHSRRASQAAFTLAVNPLNAVPGFGAAKRAAGAVYTFENNTRRLAAALKLEAKGLQGDDLLRELDKYTENYSRDGIAQEVASRIPVFGPFARFTWQMYRISKNNLRDHPVRFAETLLYTYMMKKAIEATLGSNATDEEKKAVAQEYGSQTAIRGHDEKGQPKTIDLRRVSPLGALMAGPEAERRVGEEGRAWSEYVARVIGGGMSPFFEPIQAMSTGKDTRGRSVADVFTRDEYGPLGTAGEVWRQFIGPPTFGRTLDRLEAAQHDAAISPRLPKESVDDVVLGYLLGISTGKMDYEVARKNLESLMTSKRSEVISAAGKRQRAGENRDELIGKARAMLDPVQEALLKRRATINAAEESRKKHPLPEDGK